MSGGTTKGVFITCSAFDNSAIKNVREAHHSIILVHSLKLVDLMHRYKLGIQVELTYDIKKSIMALLNVNKKYNLK